MSAWRPPALGELSGVCFSAVQAKTYEDATTALKAHVSSFQGHALTFMEVTRFKDVSRAESYGKILCYTHFESGLTVIFGMWRPSRLILDLDERIQDHGPTSFQIDGVLLQKWFCLLIWIVSVDPGSAKGHWQRPAKRKS